MSEPEKENIININTVTHDLLNHIAHLEEYISERSVERAAFMEGLKQGVKLLRDSYLDRKNQL